MSVKYLFISFLFFLHIFSSEAQVVTEPNQISFNDGSGQKSYLSAPGSTLALINQRSGDLFLGTDGTVDFSINALGDIGVGTTLPQVPFQVADGVLSGGLFNSNTIGGFMNASGNGYLSVLTGAQYESGLLFGDNLESVQGAIIYNNGSTADGFQFRTNGNTTQMTLDSQGDLGIGKFSPLRPIHVKSRNGGDEYGIMIERSGSTDTWEIAVFNGRWNWFYNRADNPVAAILTDGTYTTSDRRLKKNIRPYKEVLQLLDQLQVSTYRMKNSPEKDKATLGLIAQDVAKVFPEIVNHGPNRAGEMYYSMDYSKVGVIALKAIQELQQQLQQKEELKQELVSEVETLRAENEQLQDRVAAVEQAIARMQDNCCTNIRRIQLDQPQDLDKLLPLLKQNQPNPFSQNTRIGYFIPDEVQQATLRIGTIDGSVLKEERITDRGHGELLLETGNLGSGTYIYTLLIDGEVYESRQMILRGRR